MLQNVHLQIRVMSVQVSLEVGVSHFVEVLELAKVFALLLDSIICQVNKLVVEVVQIELFGARPDVTIFVEPAFEFPVHATDHGENSEVKLPAVD